MRLVRVTPGHYETDDGRWAVVRGTAGWYVGTVQVPGERPAERSPSNESKREAISRLARIMVEDIASE